ncbi:type IX secretion system PorP/SprF family membrane protein [Nonlabens dokdonensis]|nr:PorP/SprF family type IX secretion system membrane protein [Nonlabens dokdonensis]PZX39251.1 type IX secretion system PorP/SprF family membrane protein [Nonlabens dokdonensis]
MRIKIIYICMACCFSLKLFAQDPIFTQYYLFPETLNSGFTGFQETTKAGILHRTQWPDLNFRVDSDYANFNTWVPTMNSGIGVNFLSQRERFTNFSLSQFNLAYAYKVQLTDQWVFRPGLELGYGFKSFNFNNIVLEDQIDLGSNTINPISIDNLDPNDRVSYLDVSASLLFNNEDLWFGIALKHLNRPNISLAPGGNLPLNPLAAFTAGYELKLADYLNLRFLPYSTKLLLTANYMQQGNYNRFDIGSMFVIDLFYIGAIVATNPNRNSANSHLLTSINLIGGLQYENFKFGISHDVNVSRLGRTGGIYELSVIFTIDQKAKCFGCPLYERI